MMEFPPKRPGEAVTLTFGFGALLPAGVTLEAVLGVDVEVLRGEDADAAQCLVGAPAHVGGDVMQRFSGGELGVDYLVVARVRFSDQQVREMVAQLPVRRLV